ncbi:Putative phosphoribosyl transferase/MT0597 [Roseovarius litorisediminis]|uniref:Putative phosphoribosyl transferase/MT0597 n=1 Tax=Roseovarius litorisediminis TaxID=1312363 RepID=A0A1Y5T7U8_9RHOB|nr:phosphoribosyltransferase family protein [Roseovarius litorisediminis]SLN57873.1 Putative phosphoribosyl transferase/MT0597 [Roseovarius litorisediminis]
MYRDRTEAGQTLADRLQELDLTRPVVLALPRGGLPVAVPVAQALDAPLDLVLVRKIGLPGQPELAAGAIVDGPPEHIFFNDHILAMAGLTPDDLEGTISTKRTELAARRKMYLADRAPVDVTGCTAILVDDGIATGATVHAALLALRERGPAQVILAVPVAARDTLDALRPLVDRVVCPLVPRYFRAVGLHYQIFNQVADETVAEIMKEAATGPARKD